MGFRGLGVGIGGWGLGFWDLEFSSVDVAIGARALHDLIEPLILKTFIIPAHQGPSNNIELQTQHAPGTILSDTLTAA